MSDLHVCHVVGARPNFMKAAPVIDALSRRGVRQALVHTGQHYDRTMSEVFFEELGLPQPDTNLDVGSGSHAVQTAEIMIRFEAYIMATRPDLVFVYGDVNSTVAAALVCAKLGVRVGHVEAGLRSFDRTMPEEINRLLTDQIADMLFTPSQDGTENLLREGVSSRKIHLVGNVMIDTLIRLLPRAAARWESEEPEHRDTTQPSEGGPASEAGSEPASPANASHGCGHAPRDHSAPKAPYCLVTLHRPSNVDDPAMLGSIVETLSEIGRDLTVLFPVHPRTKAVLASRGASRPTGRFHHGGDWADGEHSRMPFTTSTLPGLHLLPPLGYLDFLALQTRASVVITDSGGMQEETTYLGVPCLTVRENTERPITVTMGTNTLVGSDTARLGAEIHRVLEGHGKRGSIPPLWDGKAGERIAAIVAGE